MASHRKLIVVWAGCSAILAGSCSSKLTRDKAVDLIRRHETLTEKLSYDVPAGTFCDAAQSPDREDFVARVIPELGWLYGARPALKTIGGKWPGNLIELEYKDVTDLVRDGPVPRECVQTMQVVQGRLGGGLGALFVMSSYHFVRWTLSITPEGVKTGLPERGGPIQIASKVFMKMTGLTNNADGTMTGEFTWRWVSTDLANALGMDKGFNTDVPGNATFKLYDDGWRITSIQASSPSPY